MRNSGFVKPYPMRGQNKSRVDDWLKVNRLQLPLPNSQSDSAVNSIPKTSEHAKSKGEKLFLENIPKDIHTTFLFQSRT